MFKENDVYILFINFIIKSLVNYCNCGVTKVDMGIKRRLEFHQGRADDALSKIKLMGILC